ncbi:Transcriptional regulator GlxA family, contains an amidase domain and an AraC-type DNA-binding HTH domain [Methylobacterium sp. UNC300MFChir4.1]|uniref:GlxA family transcriptional regulator n=1 Tax=Methylobacterium sp. UNC300MFChir4.1 TaxID=1502747 RepID=UPI0008C8B8E1|nr:DJ-1/PfpI family protein [Methylobacterium sp. UNC300MFChir4.1]SEP37337.1 Transcriptional regulator GlxA family, contains an amidase domain and an AraC-type DNA-binding HTH domain [Methylobacterium sp. UNC300MFChir4.1]
MIGILIFPEFQILDAAGPIAALEVARRREPRVLDVQAIADGAGPVRSSSGVMMHADDLQSVTALSTLIVAGGEGVHDALLSRKLLAFVETMAARGARVASVCSGAYLLAAAGLLNGRRATTHWSLTADFSARFPGVDLMPDQIYTSDGSVWTSAGISAGIDLALAMIAADYGDGLAQDAARQLVLYHRRAGGQSQFSTLLEMKSQSGRFAALLLWIRDHLHLSLTVEVLSTQAGMSARHFARAFAAEVGISPSKAVERLRIEVARERVQFSAEPIEHIAEAAGFGDPERMRRAFIRVFGHSPQSVRRMARGR